MSGRLEIQWSPLANKFITWGSDITLYEVHPLRETYPQVSGVTKISGTTCAHILATNTNHHYVKSIDIYPKPHMDLMMAIGITSGKILLSTFGPSEYDIAGYPGKELVPRHNRQCNDVAFNPTEPHLIAAVLDKHKQDNSVLVWDVTKHTLGSDYGKTVAEYGNGEFGHSVSWFRTAGKTLTCGMNLKYIGIYDIRDGSKHVRVAPTRAVYGVCINQRDDRQIASFYDNQINVWDARNFGRPVLVITPARPVLKIAWCPTRVNTISALQKESAVVNLYDIQQTSIYYEDVEPGILERVVLPGQGNNNIASFSWHPTDENRLLSIAVNGLISDYTLYDRMTLSWSPSSDIVWTYGGKTVKLVAGFSTEDISYKIHERARSRYSLEDEEDGPVKIESTDILANVWNWLQTSGRLVEDGVIRLSPIKYPGVRTLIGIDPESRKSEAVVQTWTELGNPNCQGTARFYRHPDRDEAIRLCGWPVDLLPKYLENLEQESEYTRAAAISVFNLKINSAIELLTRVPDTSDYSSSLNIVAMALAGFSDDKTSVWKQFCTNSRSKLTDPYLKAMFAFLTAENHNYDLILNESGMSVADRVAFACTFLPDGKLLEYLNSLTEQLIEEGNLDGLLLTGNDGEGLKLLQNYLNATADIQCTALIAMKAFYMHLEEEQVQLWIDSYRNLLNTWKLWHERAYFDIKLATYRPKHKPPPQVFLSCNFCGKSISAYINEINRSYNQQGTSSGNGNKAKISACPNCRKPLPRCHICLLHMGQPLGDVDDIKLTDVESWFTWCQTCRHGGHAGHMMKWFKEHQDCPVTGCNCKCFSIDAGIS